MKKTLAGNKNKILDIMSSSLDIIAACLRQSSGSVGDSANNAG